MATIATKQRLQSVFATATAPRHQGQDQRAQRVMAGSFWKPSSTGLVTSQPTSTLAPDPMARVFFLDARRTTPRS